MLKGVGALLIFLAAVGLGYSKSYEITLHEKELEEFLQIVICLKGEIRYGICPLVDAFRNTAERCGKGYREFLYETAGAMEAGDGKALGQIVRKCADKNLLQLSLTGEEREKIGQLGEKIGYLDREMQLRQLELYEEEFQMILKKLRAESPEKKKIYNSLGIMGGIMLAVLFW